MRRFCSVRWFGLYLTAASFLGIDAFLDPMISWIGDFGETTNLASLSRPRSSEHIS